MKNKKTAYYISIFVILLLAFTGLYFFNSIQKTQLRNTSGKTYAKAQVLEIIKDNVIEDGSRVGNQTVKVKILSGEYKGEIFEAQSSSGYLYGADCQVGMPVCVVINESDNNFIVSVSSYYRANAMYLIIGIFLFSLWFIGGRKGIMSILSLVFTFAVIAWLFMPMIYRGFSPFLSAVVAVSLTTVVSFLLIGGYTKKTLASIIATVAGVVLSGLFAYFFSQLSDINGYTVSDIDELQFISANTNIQIGGLLFSGILISSLGAIMDVAMSISSAIEEIHTKNSKLTMKELFMSGMNVGKDAMGTMSNTLILAFAGTSINTLVTLYAYDYPYTYVMNLYSIGIEIIQGIAGSLGIIFTVPIVAFISAFLIKKPIKKIN